MKLNTKQHYGHIYGGHVAAFEQNGKFFDGGGHELDDTGVALAQDDEEDLEAAKAFLLELLAGATIMQKTVVKEAESQGISWHNVENAANELNVIKIKIKNAWNWRLTEE